jgi:hypothetical protein
MKPKKIEEQLEKLSNEIAELFHHLNLFKQLNEIIKKNENLQKMDPTLLQWMKRAFTIDLVIGIGRICDKDKRTFSLVRLLEELKEPQNADYLTRERYTALYNADPILKKLYADSDFDHLAGAGQKSFSKNIISADIKQLTKEEPFKKIKTFRDEYLAHMDWNRKKVSIIYNELYQAFKVIEEVDKKYNLLISASGLISSTPTPQGNWREVLTISWISKCNSRKM